MNPKLKTYMYKNITISGLPGCGSTTLLEGLKEELQYDGWKGFSGGEFMREYATEKGLFDAKSKEHHSANVYDDDFDRQVDLGIREKLSTEENWILESWLSGFMAQGVTGTLKILMTCSDDAVRIDRIVNRDGVSVDEAKVNMEKRYHTNVEKWRRLYSDQWQEWVVATGKAKQEDPIDFWLPDLYDIVIDTYTKSKEDTLKSVIDAITKS
jgi:cytidylate kinase